MLPVYHISVTSTNDTLSHCFLGLSYLSSFLFLNAAVAAARVLTQEIFFLLPVILELGPSKMTTKR